MKALIIDDSYITRSVLRHFLRSLGIESIEACDGYQALERLHHTNGIDVAMVDWGMPKMDGFSLVKTLRKNPEYRDLKIIMVTSRDAHSDMEWARKVGADDYITKPITKAILMEKLFEQGPN